MTSTTSPKHIRTFASLDDRHVIVAPAAYPTSGASQLGKPPNETSHTIGGPADVANDCADTHDNHIEYAYRAMPTHLNTTEGIAS